ncbi:MAG: DNA primase, partial [Rhodospirillales bacterium]|nr:DNA primase [Rhodospirillales bacterium]
MEIPAETPEARERAKRADTLHEVMSRAGVFYAKQLRMPAGRPALAYLRDRGLEEETIAGFQLGFAPDDRGALKSTLMGEGISEQLMIEGGLLIRPEDAGGRAAYDRFRGRVMFPINDGRGRCIGFGGRILGSGEPKYLNSPETPLFHKGRTLYGLKQAWERAREVESVVVAEGYTDVLALHQAGLSNAVAPLGTALTEDQMVLLWRMAPAQILCLDGDRAGRKAGLRAALRALPLLSPGRFLRIALLPDGEDPDSLIKSGGPGAMEAVIAGAEPLADFLWRSETEGRPLNSPDHRAWLEKRLMDITAQIADPTVKAHYQSDFRNRLWEKKKNTSNSRNAGSRRKDSRSNWKREAEPSPQMAEKSGVATRVDVKRRREEVLLATLITHPDLFDALGEALGELNFSSPDLEKLRQEVLNILSNQTGLDFTALETHFSESGLASSVKDVLGENVFDHANFARPGGPSRQARDGWEQILRLYKRDQLRHEINEAERRLAVEPSDEAFRLLRALKEMER